jgi:DNA-binding transcriptional ArsR family regulator
MLSPILPTELGQMQQTALQVSQLLKTLAHADRLLLLCQLSQGRYCVNELAQLTGIKQPTLSQQLGVLRNEQMVATEKIGKHVYYRVNNDDTLAVLQFLYSRFCPAPTAIAVENPVKEI